MVHADLELRSKRENLIQLYKVSRGLVETDSGMTIERANVGRSHTKLTGKSVEIVICYQYY